ncbi:MAG: hypothetical protein M1830_010791 [Pleopsidium flavum]|nr:MAG: hypothetical protein M1830_010791 [Pleopsidium flavum]
MPVTFHPSTKPLTAVGQQFERSAKDPSDLLERSCQKELSKRCGEIFQSSFTSDSPQSRHVGRFAATDLTKTAVYPAKYGNGFVGAALKAYNGHHHLVIRPDDVWMTILTQFNVYVNANSDRLRNLFVEHEGQKELEVQSGGNRYTVDFGGLADEMGRLIQENVLDPELRDWIVPDFTTTTSNDRIVSAVIMMATLSQYFTYKFTLMCGIPAVTLLGEKSDWQALRAKIDKLPTYGEDAAQWAELLRPVLDRFVTAFDKPDSGKNRDFWQRIAHYSGGGSGPTYLSGWITAFCFFDDKGKSLYPQNDSGTGGNARRGFGRVVDSLRGRSNGNAGVLYLDEVRYHRVDDNDIPPGYAYVKVKLNDNGTEFKTVMVAGLVGMRVESSGMKEGSHDGENDTWRPEAGWWMFEDKDSKN